MGDENRPIDQVDHARRGLIVHWEFDFAANRFTDVSQEAGDLLGAPVSDWLKQGFWRERLHPEDATWAPGFCFDATCAGQSHELVYRMMHDNGEVVWVYDVVEVDPVLRENSRIRGLLTDITHLAAPLSEAASGVNSLVRAVLPSGSLHSGLLFSSDDATYRTLMTRLPFGLMTFVVAHGELVAESANGAACALLGRPFEKIHAMPICELLPEAGPRLVEFMGHEGAALPTGPKTFDLTVWQAERALDVHGLRIGERAVAVTLLDVTSREQAISAHSNNLIRLTSLTHRMSQTEENERRKLAEIVHDNIAQPLAVARMYLKRLEQECGHEDFPVVLELLGLAIQESRAISTELFPAALDDMGLPNALAALCCEMQELHKLEFRLTRDGACDDRVGSPARMTLFRGARELMINAVKHARASTVSVTLEGGRRHYRVVIEDDGIGFDPAVASRKPVSLSIGLPSVHQRLERLGGSLRVESTPGHGTRAAMTVPLLSEHCTLPTSG